METYVLIPKEFSLVVQPFTMFPDKSKKQSFEIGVWANTPVERGTKIFSFHGTVRMDNFNADTCVDPSDVRYRFGLYDELVAKSCGEKIRYCNWIRFLRCSAQFTNEVNLVASKINAAPLDLSKSLIYRKYYPSSPSSDSDELKSVSSDSLNSLSGDPDVLNSRIHLRYREKNLLPCNVCNKTFDRPSLLKRHMRTHTGEKPHACDVCGKAFSTSSSLNTHRRIHSGEKPHQCGVCGKRFTASSNLYYHRMTHIKEKPHKCHLCSKSFPTPGDLKSHMYVHNGSWPYKCHICGRGFSKHTNLKNHLFLHTGSKPHMCKICKKRFALACNLRAHLRTHDDIHQKIRATSILPLEKVSNEYHHSLSLLHEKFTL